MLPDAGGRGRGRRDNGLSASSFASVGDVDPRVGEHLLDVLALDGIAAFLQPTIDHDSVTRAVRLPGHPTDRLYVDRYRAADARALVAAVAAPESHPDTDAPDDDAAWQAIIASYHRESTATVPPWPVDEDTEVRPMADQPSADADADVDVDEEEAEADEEEGYVPPPPPPLPRISKQTAGGLLLIAAGLFVLVLGSRVLGLDGDLAFRVGLVSVIAGVGYLIWRMRDDAPDEDRPDDGAVV